MSLLNKTKIEGILQSYSILKCLDQGSQGQVYQVLGDDQKIYALKISNFMKEGEVTFLNKYFQFLQSNNELLKQYEYFLYQNRYVIIQEYCSGGNLYNYMLSHPLTNLEIKKILLEITRQLDALHQLNLAHRDIKPENILIQIDEMNETKKYKLCDFGEIKEIKDVTKRAFQTIGVGTPYYQSPEVLETSNYDLTIDIWSLGAMMYELYTNTPLFNGPSQNAISDQIKNYILDQSFIHSLIDKLKIDEHLKASIKSMLDADPKNRPSLQDVQEIWTLRKSVDFKEIIEKKKEVNQLSQTSFQFPIQQFAVQNTQSFGQQFNLQMNQQQIPINRTPQNLSNQLSPQLGQGFQIPIFNNNVIKFQQQQNNFGKLPPSQQNFPPQQSFPVQQQNFTVQYPVTQQYISPQPQSYPTQQLHFPVLQPKQNFPPSSIVQQEDKQYDGQNKQQFERPFPFQNNQIQFSKPQNQVQFKNPQFLIQWNQQSIQPPPTFPKEEKSKLLISQIVHKEISKKGQIKIISQATNVETQVNEEELIQLSRQIIQEKVSETDQNKIEPKFQESKETLIVQESYQKKDLYEAQLEKLDSQPQNFEDIELKKQPKEPKNIQNLLQSVFNFPLKPIKMVDQDIQTNKPYIIQELTNQLCEQFQIFLAKPK